MAPINSAKAIQQNGRRPSTAPKAIVPAIPLAYVQKRQKQQVARAKVQAEEALPVTPPVEEEIPESPVPEKIITNGTSERDDEPKPAQPQAETIQEPGFAVAPAASDTTEEEEAAGSASEEPAPTALVEEESSGPQQTPNSAPSEETQSSTSRSTYQMPPPFVPSSTAHHAVMTTETGHFPPPPNFHTGQHPMHHAHPSAGSLRFGGYPESNNSSPAPPPSAGNMPPLPYPQPPHGVGRHGPQQSNGGHSQQMSNGYSPMGPPPPPGYFARPEPIVNHGPGAENFARRQIGQFAPPEGYSPSATPMAAEHQRYNSFDPSTPHSFQGSQSSAPHEQENNPTFFNQYPAAAVYGSNGHIDDVRLYQPPRPKARGGSQAVAPAGNAYHPPPMTQPPVQMEHYDGLIQYLQSQFGDPTYADYTLELRYSDDRAPPVRIPGHNLLFARSPKLKSLMHAQGSTANHDGVKTLLIESDDRFLRSDSFWMAVQRLYGGPLLDYGALAALNALPNTQIQSPMPGNPLDRCDLALGYAAAGCILQIPPVITRGIEIANHFVNWSTMDKIFDFALDGGLDSQWNPEIRDQRRSLSTYGPAVNALISNALDFIISRFPPNFELDVSVGDFSNNSRLPKTREERPHAANHRLSSIKFGDHPTEESVKSTSSNSETVVLSRVLINMPFHLLKYVLEAPRLGNVEIWANTALRVKIMHAVVEEREKRRLKANGDDNVSNAEHKTAQTTWEELGFAESVEFPNGHEGSSPTPTLIRRTDDHLLPSQST